MWEYKILYYLGKDDEAELIRWLNEQGSCGWEMCGYEFGNYFFKRKIEVM